MMTQLIDPLDISGVPREDSSHGVGSLDSTSLEELRSQGIDSVEKIQDLSQLRDISDALDSSPVIDRSAAQECPTVSLDLINSQQLHEATRLLESEGFSTPKSFRSNSFFSMKRFVQSVKHLFSSKQTKFVEKTDKLLRLSMAWEEQFATSRSVQTPQLKEAFKTVLTHESQRYATKYHFGSLLSNQLSYWTQSLMDYTAQFSFRHEAPDSMPSQLLKPFTIEDVAFKGDFEMAFSEAETLNIPSQFGPLTVNLQHDFIAEGGEGKIFKAHAKNGAEYVLKLSILDNQDGFLKEMFLSKMSPRLISRSSEDSHLISAYDGYRIVDANQQAYYAMLMPLAVGDLSEDTYSMCLENSIHAQQEVFSSPLPSYMSPSNMELVKDSASVQLVRQDSSITSVSLDKLQSLIKCSTDMTFLSHLKDCDTPEQCHRVLSDYFNLTELEASLDVSAIYQLSNKRFNFLIGFEQSSVYSALKDINSGTIRELSDLEDIVSASVQVNSIDETTVADKASLISQFLSYWESAFTAVQNLHDNGLVHRDLKPENIFKMKDASLKLADFGLVVSQGQEVSSVEGTLKFMPPEAVLSSSQIMAADGSFDIWSLGVMMFQQVTGDAFFENDRASLESKLSSFSIQDTLTKYSHLGPFVQTLLCRCLEVDPKKRATIGELQGLLAAYRTKMS